MFLPNDETEPLAYSALNFRTIVCLWKKPVKGGLECDYFTETGDLLFVAAKKDSDFERDWHITVGNNLEISIPEMEITVWQTVTQVQDSIKTNVKMLSVSDLAGSQIVVYLQHDYPRSARDTNISQKRRSVTGPFLKFQVQGHEYDLDVRSKVESRGVYLYATFPTNVE